jgi:hypothetical protein
MGILDEAIKEHLELKRQHGAADDELSQLEDEAFGAAARPGDEEMASPAPADPFSEAPTEFMSSGTTEAPQPAAEASVAPVPEAPPEPASETPAPHVPVEPAPEPPAPEPVSEEHPAMEHEAVAEPPAPEAPAEPEPSAEQLDRQAIADQPTELYDVPGELAKESPGEEELYEAEAGEPRLAGDEPLEEDVDIDDDFFDEKSLSAELDQALDAPEGVASEEAPVIEPESSVPAVVDPEPEVETPEAEPEIETPEAEPPPPEPAAPEPEPAPEEPPQPEPAEAEAAPEPEVETAPEPTEEQPGGAFFDQEEDVLEETPEFLQDAPESDRLWFEQKPPKDFDFDD